MTVLVERQAAVVAADPELEVEPGASRRDGRRRGLLGRAPPSSPWTSSSSAPAPPLRRPPPRTSADANRPSAWRQRLRPRLRPQRRVFILGAPRRRRASWRRSGHARGPRRDRASSRTSAPPRSASLRGLAPLNDPSPRIEPSPPSWTTIFARFGPTSPVTMADSASSLASVLRPSSESRLAPVLLIASAIAREPHHLEAVRLERLHHLLADQRLLRPLELGDADALAGRLGRGRREQKGKRQQRSQQRNPRHPPHRAAAEARPAWTCGRPTMRCRDWVLETMVPFIELSSRVGQSRRGQRRRPMVRQLCCVAVRNMGRGGRHLVAARAGRLELVDQQSGGRVRLPPLR